jgi:hypothetical protein
MGQPMLPIDSRGPNLGPTAHSIAPSPGLPARTSSAIVRAGH